jgi:acyl-CoA thioesterase FadM
VTPLVDVGARFLAPARYDDELRVRAEVTQWREKRFRIDYSLTEKNMTVAIGFEQRAWAVRTESGELRRARVSAEFKELMQ